MKPVLFTTAAVLPWLGLAACGGMVSSGEGTTPSQVASASAAQAAVEPPLDEMSLARPPSKVGVPVEVRYQLGSAAVQGQPTTLQLAFTPRVAGQNLRVEFLPSDSVTIQSGGAPFAQQKTAAADVHRRSLIVTRRKAGPSELRVLVSMNAGGGRYFGIFTVPVGEAAADR